MAELLEKLSILEKDQTNSLGINSERTLKTCKLVREAILLLSRCYDIFPRQISFSFNGGKDSTVVLHLIRMALAEQTNFNSKKDNESNSTSSVKLQSNSDKINSFYFKNDECQHTDSQTNKKCVIILHTHKTEIFKYLYFIILTY